MHTQKKESSSISLAWLPRCGFVAAAFVVIATGCGSGNQADVSGRVTLAGEPLEEGQVTFHPLPETPGPEFSGQVVNGDFKVAKSVLPGKYSVSVRAWKKTGRIVKDSHGEMSEEMVNAIPARYRGPESELSAEIAAGDNSLNLELQL